jgi:hypothetical protein
MPKKTKNDTQKKVPIKKRDEDDDDSDSDSDDDETSGMDAHKLQPFKLGRSAKLAGFTFLAFILLMSDVFVLRVMDRANVGLVSGRCPTKKGLVAQGVLLAFAMIIFDFLITKEKL